MGYQSTLLGAVGSVGSSISIATLLHRQSPEYQAKVEKERLKMKAVQEANMQANERDFIRDTAGKGYAYDKGEIDKNNVVTLDQDERREAALNYHQSNYDLAKKHYMNDPNPKYIGEALEANTYANNAMQLMEKAKEEKRWRNMPTNMGMTAGEITDRLGPKAEKIVKKEMTK